MKSTAIDSTYIKRSALRSVGKGAFGKGDRRSRGGWITKVHALTNLIGCPYALTRNAGNVSDIKAAPALHKRAGRMRYLLADKSYDSDHLR